MKYLRNPYPYCNLGIDTAIREDGAACVRIFKFYGNGKDNKKEAYYIHFHLYTCELVAIKFYLKRHKSAKDKYRKLSNFHDASRVLATCLKCMFDYLEKHPFSSFCFIGMPCEGEVLSKTKRFSVYEKIMKREFSPITFEHKRIMSKSLYFLINKNVDKDELLQTITEIHNTLPEGWMY